MGLTVFKIESEESCAGLIPAESKRMIKDGSSVINDQSVLVDPASTISVFFIMKKAIVKYKFNIIPLYMQCLARNKHPQPNS